MTAEREELHLFYRPQNFDEYIGGKALKESILASLSSTRTYLFCGPRGCGKTTLARLIAKELQISDVDIHEIDAADKTGVDDARQIKAAAAYAPMGGKKKIYIIDECHRLSGNAWDSLLKTLEQPPKHCYFVLCTTELAKVPQTIKSRSTPFEVQPLMRREAEVLIDWICENEGIELDVDVRKTILDKCEGIPREIVIAISMVRSIKDKDDAISLIASAIHNTQVLDLCKALLAKDKWEKVTAILKNLNEEPENIRYAVLSYMWKVGINSGFEKAAQAVIVIDWFEKSFMYSKKAGLLAACWHALE